MAEQEEWRIEQPAPKDMMVPVQCLRCRRVYDLCRTLVIHRYSDCTFFFAPCCGAKVDDRPEGWGGGIRKLTREEAAVRPEPGRWYREIDGTIWSAPEMEY